LLEAEGTYEKRVLNRFQVESFATNQAEKRAKERKKQEEEEGSDC
jgi:hypothetical protein